MKVQMVTAYCVSHLKRYGVTVRGNVTSVYPPLCFIILGSLYGYKINKLNSHMKTKYSQL
jgi:hypothetical protein